MKDKFGTTFSTIPIFAYQRSFPQFIHMKFTRLRTYSSTHLSTSHLCLQGLLNHMNFMVQLAVVGPLFCNFTDRM